MNKTTLITAATLLLLTGCRSGPDIVSYARPYPEPPIRGRMLDIQVFRAEQVIELTNTTAHAFGPSTLWLNAQFSRPIDGLAVGQTLKLSLAEFRNEYSERFRGGGFFATEKPERLVLAELETTINNQQKLLGLAVVGNQNN